MQPMSLGGFYRALFILLAFACGVVFGTAYTRLSDRFPDVNVMAASISNHGKAPSAPNTDVVPTFLGQFNVEQRRAALWRKIYGGQRSAQTTSRQRINTERLTSAYTRNEVFKKYYGEVLEKRGISITEIQGNHEELEGYVWRSLLFTQQKDANGKLFIFHHGHLGSPFGFASINEVISRMMQDGHDVLVLSMPATSWNKMENVRIKTWDGWGFLSGSHRENHALFQMIDAGQGHFIKFFVDPIFTSLDIALMDRHYRNVTMVGHSGGGWSTTLAAALDVRIDRSISYAGTLPFFARRTALDMGDAEQQSSEFYREFPYTLLYELASASERGGRLHYQIFNSDDNCCFGRSGWLAFKQYYESRRPPFVGDFRMAVVENDRHDIIPEALLKILAQSDLPTN